MAVRGDVRERRYADLRRAARRNVITRTARAWTRLYKGAVPDLKATARRSMERGERELPAKFTKSLSRMMRSAYAYGYWLSHLYVQEQKAARKGEKYRGKVTLADVPSDDELRRILEAFMNFEDVDGWDAVIPQEALDWLEGYVPSLAGNFSADILEKAHEILQSSLATGGTLKERMRELSEVLRLSNDRLETIARTEITRADTLGRLVSMKAHDDVIGVEFSAIMDDRTTEICSSRHGLIMRLDDPRLAENTPPCHPRCRSVLLPCTVYEYPDGLLTSHEYDEVPAGMQRPEDIEEVLKILG